MTLAEIIHALCGFADTHPELVDEICVARIGEHIEAVVDHDGIYTTYIIGAPL